MTQRATFVLLTALPLMGCGGQDTMPTEEKEANVEEAAAPDEAPVKHTLRPGFRFLKKRPSGPVEGGKLEVIA